MGKDLQFVGGFGMLWLLLTLKISMMMMRMMMMMMTTVTMMVFTCMKCSGIGLAAT